MGIMSSVTISRSSNLFVPGLFFLLRYDTVSSQSSQVPSLYEDSRPFQSHTNVSPFQSTTLNYGSIRKLNVHFFFFRDVHISVPFHAFFNIF